MTSEPMPGKIFVGLPQPKTGNVFGPGYFPMMDKGFCLTSIATQDSPSHIIYIKGGPVGPGLPLLPGVRL